MNKNENKIHTTNMEWMPFFEDYVVHYIKYLGFCSVSIYNSLTF